MNSADEESTLKDEIKQLKKSLRKRARIQKLILIALGAIGTSLALTSWELEGQVAGQKYKASSGAERATDVLKWAIPSGGIVLSVASFVNEESKTEKDE